MRRRSDMPGAGRSAERDLFGKRPLVAIGGDRNSAELALTLRQMSEMAFRVGLDRSSSLIEVAALMVELEGAVVAQDAADI